MEKSLQATFVNAKKGTILDEKEHVDLCCRSLHKCDSYKHIELNQRIEWHIRDCECVHSFQTCLKSLNTSLSNEVAFIYSINATKCHSSDHPIIKCTSIKFETYAEPNVQFVRFMNSAEREKYFKRCVKYELDEIRPQQLQIFDVPFNEYAMSTITGMFINNMFI